MNKEDRKNILSLYEDRLNKYGHSVKTVGWGGKEDQNLRFDILFRGINIDNKSILDLGCGLGDMAGYLIDRNIENFQYMGVDLSEKLIEQAKCKYASNNIEFIAQDATSGELPSADIVVASGMLTFNIEYNKKNIENIMHKLFNSSNEVLAINFMSGYADFELEKNLHFCPEKIFSYAKKITSWVNLYHDYPLYEFTVQLRRKATYEH